MYSVKIEIACIPDYLLPINHTFDRFFWDSYYIITKEYKHNDNTAVVIIFKLNNNNHINDTSLNYQYLNHIHYFRSDIFCKINTFIKYQIIKLVNDENKNTYIQINFNQESYILNTSDDTLSKYQRLENNIEFIENTPARITHFQEMIKEFDKSKLNDTLQYIVTDTVYSGNTPISGIYRCFFFCGYIKDIPVHQVVGQVDTSDFFSFSHINVR